MADYTMRKGKESGIASKRHSMGESQHDSANAFVKAEQNATKSMGGHSPSLKSEAMKFNSYMCNNGEHAQDLARTITKGLDKKAYPVR